MKIYKVNNIDHKVYEPDDEMPGDLLVLSDWRIGKVGEWVITDDECVLQILRRGTMLRAKGKNRIKEYVGTCTGTFPVGDKVKMDASRRENIYSFSGSKEPNTGRSLTKKEELFVYYLSVEKLSPEEAYLKAFPTNNSKYASEKAASLIKTERVTTAVKEELKPILEELGISESYILKGIKTTAELADKEDVKLRALFKLADIMDLEDKNQTKVTQLTGVAFSGFDNQMLETAERPKELEDGNEKK